MKNILSKNWPKLTKLMKVGNTSNNPKNWTKSWATCKHKWSFGKGFISLTYDLQKFFEYQGLKHEYL